MNESARCTTCNADLAYCDSIFAALGKLYCSRTCGVKDFASSAARLAEHNFDCIADEITPEEIGLRSYSNE